MCLSKNHSLLYFTSFKISNLRKYKFNFSYKRIFFENNFISSYWVKADKKSIAKALKNQAIIKHKFNLISDRIITVLVLGYIVKDLKDYLKTSFRLVNFNVSPLNKYTIVTCEYWFYNVNFLRKERLYTKLKYSRSPAYDMVSGGIAALFAGLVGFLITEKFGFELVDSGDFYYVVMYFVFICFSIKTYLASLNLIDYVFFPLNIFTQSTILGFFILESLQWFFSKNVFY